MSSTTNIHTKVTGSFLTRSSAFQRLSHWAYSVCDADRTGKINQDELYAGVLLVHVNLAKYAGAAACYPPTRGVVNELFEAADADKSGTIDQEEFNDIVKMCSANIAGRILVYYSLLILLVPYLADVVVYGIFQMDDWMGWKLQLLEQNSSLHLVTSIVSWKELCDRMVSMALFFLVIPMLFNYIDRRAKMHTEKSKSP